MTSEAILTFVACAALVFWALALLNRPWPAGQFLRGPPGPPGVPVDRPQPAEGGGPEPPEVAAVVPARNEAEVLPRTLPPLLLQDHPRFRVVLVDDGSTDGTALSAARLAAEASAAPLSVVEAKRPPPGWTGKVHALHQGVAAAEGLSRPEWLLLTDADIFHPADSLRALLERAAAGRYDLVSVMARLRADNFWERLLIPPFVFFFHLLYPFGSVSGSRTAAAAGGCILVRRSILRKAGGLEAIAGELIDDVALARAVRAAGGRLWLGFDPGIVSVRGYPRLGDLWRMVSRTAFTQLKHRWDLLCLTTAALLGLVVAPPFLVAAALLRGQALAGAAALGAWLLPAAMLLPFTRYHRVPAAYSLAFPGAGLLYLLMTLSSAWDHLRRRGPLWKGRRYSQGGREFPWRSGGGSL